MSMHFDDALNEHAQKTLEALFGDKIIARDDHDVLLDKIDVLLQAEMRELANVASQPVTVELHDIGEHKTVAGTEYVVTPDGWRKVEEK